MRRRILFYALHSIDHTLSNLIDQPPGNLKVEKTKRMIAVRARVMRRLLPTSGPITPNPSALHTQ